MAATLSSLEGVTEPAPAWSEPAAPSYLCTALPWLTGVAALICSSGEQIPDLHN